MKSVRRAVNRASVVSRSLALSAKGGQAVQVARRVRAERITYLDLAALVDLWREVEAAEEGGRDGVIVEAGTALGGSSVMLASARRSMRPLLLFDTFGMIPPPSAADGPAVGKRYGEIVAGKSSGISGDVYYGYQGDLRPVVRSNLEAHGCDLGSITLVQGLYEDTMALDGPIAAAHIDCDWYESVALCLARIWPHLVPGGVMIIDDYDHWEGCRRAVDEFIARTPGVRTRRRARIQLVRDP